MCRNNNFWWINFRSGVRKQNSILPWFNILLHSSEHSREAQIHVIIIKFDDTWRSSMNKGEIVSDFQEISIKSSMSHSPHYTRLKSLLKIHLMEFIIIIDSKMSFPIRQAPGTCTVKYYDLHHISTCHLIGGWNILTTH